MVARDEVERVAGILARADDERRAEARVTGGDDSSLRRCCGGRRPGEDGNACGADGQRRDRGQSPATLPA